MVLILPSRPMVAISIYSGERSIHRARLLFDPTLSVEHLGFARDYATLANKSFGYGIASARLAYWHFPPKVRLDFTGNPGLIPFRSS